MTTEDPRPINTLSIRGNLDLNTPETELRFEDGRILRVPTALLQQQEPFAPSQPSSLSATDNMIPLVEEQLEVGKHVIETGYVHLHQSSEAYDVTLDEPLAVNTWKVERVQRNEVVAEPPAPRQEGSTTIYPLVEERLILTKELVLVEEIYIIRELTERRDNQKITLRRETLNVEREPAPQS